MAAPSESAAGERVSFVAGATGFVGRQLVAQLAARGRRTVAHVRPDSAQLPQWRGRFAELGAETDATPWQREALAARFGELRPEAIYVCIGTTQKRAKADAVGGNPYERVDYGLTKLIVEAAQDAAKAAGGEGGSGGGGGGASYRPRIVYLSSIGASASVFQSGSGARSVPMAQDYRQKNPRLVGLVLARDAVYVLAHRSPISRASTRPLECPDRRSTRRRFPDSCARPGRR